MKALVVYDTNYGNTKIIADAIAKELKSKALSVSELGEKDLSGVELLVVGSPINGWRPTERINKFLNSLNKDQLNGVKVAAFDTRVKLFIHGDAAGKISRGLEKAGGVNIAAPRGFIVKGTEGPLLDGEMEKAINWVRSMSN